MYTYTIVLHDWNRKYMRPYTAVEMIKDNTYSQIYYHCTKSNTFNLKMGLNCKILLIEIGIGTGKNTTEHTTKLMKLITKSQGNMEYYKLEACGKMHWMILIAIYKCRKIVVVRTIMVVPIYTLTDRKKLIIFNIDWVVAMNVSKIINITMYFWTI